MKTVEVPVAWIERLVEIVGNIDPRVSDVNLAAKLSHFRGYIESANAFLGEEESEK